MVNISDVLKSSKHGGIEDISSEDLPDDNRDGDSQPGAPEDHDEENEHEQDDKINGYQNTTYAQT